MVKKILLCVIILFALCGCSSKNNINNDNNNKIMVNVDGNEYELYSESNINKLHYKENYTDFRTEATGKMRTMYYLKDNQYIFQVRIMYEDEHSFEDNVNMLNYEKSKKIINGIEYTFMEYLNDTNDSVHTYMTYYDNVTYAIMFISSRDVTELENVFMNNIYFKNN